MSPTETNEPAETSARRDTDASANETDESPGDDSGTLSQMSLDFYALYKKEQADRVNAYKKYVSSPHYETHLRSAHKALTETPVLTVGSLVQWKTFLKGSEFPDYGNPAVVIELLETPLQTNPEGHRLLIPHDIVIGYLDGDQDLIVLSTGSVRLTSWESTT